MKLEITKEKVLEAASKCPQAKETLKTLFPEIFKEEILTDCRTYEIFFSRGLRDQNGNDLLWWQVNDNEITLSKNFNWRFGKSKHGEGWVILIPTPKDSK